MISGHVDVNDDGDFAIPETGIAGVTVTLVGTDNTGAPVSDATTTDEFGYYEFIGLAPGTVFEETNAPTWPANPASAE